jgi:hypothetical protein
MAGISGPTKNGASFLYNQPSLYTTHQITWSSTSVSFKSLNGFQTDNTDTLQSWESAASFASAVPRAAAPIHLSLRIVHSPVGDLSPTNNAPVEVILHNFTHQNQSTSAAVSAIQYEARLANLPIFMFVSFTIMVQTGY